MPDMDNEELENETTSNSPTGFGGAHRSFLGLIVTVLKWVLLIIVGVVVVAAINVGVNYIMNRGDGAGRQSQSSVYDGVQPVRSWYDGIGEIRVSTKDSTPYTVVIRVQLGYKQDDKAIQTALVSQNPYIKAKVREYFSEKRVNELNDEAKIAAELKQKINNIIGGKGIDIVIITEKTVIEM